MFATIWCYILVLISIIFRGYLIADSICYCQLLSANIGYYLFCLLLSIIICSCLVTSINICCFSSYLWLSFVSSSGLWLSTIVMLLSDIICCSWPISAIYLSIYDDSLHFFTICLLSGTICDYLLSCSTISNDHIFSVMIYYCQLCSPNMCDCACRLSGTTCNLLLLPSVTLCDSLWCATISYNLVLPVIISYAANISCYYLRLSLLWAIICYCRLWPGL